jgi:hypothetical protein
MRVGTLPLLAPRPHKAFLTYLPTAPRGRVRVLDGARDDDLEVLAKAPAVVGVGGGLAPERYAELRPLLDVLGAELAGTRNVTDRGWLPRSRQLGLTGLSIRPRLYLAIGVSGKFNHMIGVRGAGCVLAVNNDPDAPVFEAADIGIVGDWQEVVPQLVQELAGATPLGSPAGSRPALGATVIDPMATPSDPRPRPFSSRITWTVLDRQGHLHLGAQTKLRDDVTRARPPSPRTRSPSRSQSCASFERRATGST